MPSSVAKVEYVLEPPPAASFSRTTTSSDFATIAIRYSRIANNARFNSRLQALSVEIGTEMVGMWAICGLELEVVVTHFAALP